MHYIGVDIGGMSIKCGIVDGEGKIIFSDTVATPRSGAEDIATATAQLVSSVMEKNKIDKYSVVGVGVGVPGIVDIKSQEVKYSCNLFKQNAPLGKLLQERLGMRVKIANDADCAAYGECLFGAGKGAKDMILVTLGTGVGGGIIADGKPFAGGSGLGGEIGHMGVGGSTKCSCGRRGCLETLVSATALIRRTKERIESEPKSILAQVYNKNGVVDGKTIFEAMDKGCEEAQKLFEEFVADLGYGLVNLANIFRPQMILIGGGMSAQGERLTAPLQEYVDQKVYGGVEIARTVVKKAELGNSAGIIGAGFLLNE